MAQPGAVQEVMAVPSGQTNFRDVRNARATLRRASDVPLAADTGVVDEVWAAELYEERQAHPPLRSFLLDVDRSITNGLTQAGNNFWLTNQGMNTLFLRKRTLAALSKILLYDYFVVVVCFL